MKTQILAEDFGAAVAARDHDTLGTLLGDEVRLRALLPARIVEDLGREAVLARYVDWFGGYARVELVRAAGDTVGDRLLIHYTVVADHEAGPHVLAQTLMCGVYGDRIGKIDLVCSGWRPAP
ncbi:MAG: hypothetical protein ACLGH4_02325 [Actinomycetes bacterium]